MNYEKFQDSIEEYNKKYHDYSKYCIEDYKKEEIKEDIEEDECSTRSTYLETIDTLLSSDDTDKHYIDSLQIDIIVLKSILLGINAKNLSVDEFNLFLNEIRTDIREVEKNINTIQNVFGGFEDKVF